MPISYMNSEGWGVQLRSFARGSDGLAEICQDDAQKVIIPLLDSSVRDEISSFVDNLKEGRNTLNSTIKQMIKDKEIEYYDPNKRPSHIVLV
jgi:type I restriction enzyme M protein